MVGRFLQMRQKDPSAPQRHICEERLLCLSAESDRGRAETRALLCPPLRRAQARRDARFPLLGDRFLIPGAVASGLFSDG